MHYVFFNFQLIVQQANVVCKILARCDIANLLFIDLKKSIFNKFTIKLTVAFYVGLRIGKKVITRIE